MESRRLKNPERILPSAQGWGGGGGGGGGGVNIKKDECG
jgi:hypothetical protein